MADTPHTQTSETAAAVLAPDSRGLRTPLPDFVDLPDGYVLGLNRLAAAIRDLGRVTGGAS